MCKLLKLLSIISLLSVSCGQKPNLSTTKIVIGSNDLQYYESDDNLSQAIGKVALGCTATHIGNNIVLTAGHCVKSTNCRADKYNVTWNYRRDNRSGDFTSRCLEVIRTENNGNRDYAILRYDSAPDAYIDVNKSQKPRKGDALTILSHPQGQPLSWSGWCKHSGAYEGNKFSYNCDTKGGSSGAVVLNEDLEIVGIHNLGNSSYQINAGTYIQSVPL